MSGPSASEIDAVIRAVLADLIGREPTPTAPRASDSEVFAGRLFALRHAEALGSGVRQLGLAPGTVVTPLARDWAKRRGVTLRTVSEIEIQPRRRDGVWGFAVEPTDGVAIAFRRSMLDDPAGWLELEPEDLVGWVAAEEVRGALLVSAASSLAVWRAHQVPGIRAAAVNDSESVARATRFLGSNLIVAEPFGNSVHSLRQLGSSFRRAGAPTPPTGLTDRTPRRGPNPGLNGHEDRRGDWSRDAFPPTPQLTQRPLPGRLADDHSRLARWLAGAR